MRALVWWLVGGPIIYALMMAPASILAGVCIIPLVLIDGPWREAYAFLTLALAALFAIYLVRTINRHEKEVEKWQDILSGGL